MPAADLKKILLSLKGQCICYRSMSFCTNDQKNIYCSKPKLTAIPQEQELTPLTKCIYLWGLPLDHNSLLHHWQRIGHSPGSKAKPSRLPRRHGCIFCAPPRMWYGRAWTPFPSHSVGPAPSSPASVRLGCTHHWAETPPHLWEDTLLRIRLLGGSCVREYSETWFEYKTCHRSRKATHLCIWLRKKQNVFRQEVKL